MNLTLKEVSLCTAWRRAWIFEQIKTGGLKRVERSSTGRNGKPVVLVPLHSLPAYAQQKHLAFIAQKLLAESGFRVNGRDYGIHKLLDNPKDLEEALRRFAIVQDPATPNSTVYRWRQRWLASNDLSALVRKERSDRGSLRSFDDHAIAFMMAHYYKGQNKRKSYNALVAEAERRGGEWFVGSFKQACRIITRKTHAAQRMIVAGGPRALEDKVLPPIMRKPPELPNERWCADHHQCDVFVRIGNKLVRPWLTAFEDEGTRAIIGFCLTTAPSSKSIAIALRHGILRKPDEDTPFHGVPAEVHIDNGKDFISRYISGDTWRVKHFKVALDLETEGVLAQLGIRPIYAQAYNAKSKIIERWFGTLEEQFGKDQKGYCGADTKSKPEGFREAWARYSRNVDGWQRDWLQWEMFFDGLKKFVRKYNHNIHRTLGTSPVKKWCESVDAGFVPVTINSPDLDILLLKKQNTMVTNGGVKVPGLIGRHWHQDLMAYIGQRVTVRYNPMELQTVQVFIESRLLCTAEYQSPVAHNAKEETRMAIMRKKQIKRDLKAQREELLAPLNGGDKYDVGQNVEDASSPLASSDEPKSSYMDDLEMIDVWKDE